MKVQAMLARKGDQVVTVRPDATIADAIELLREKKIGALVVSDDGARVEGILSERDVVRALVTHGDGLLQEQVSEFMTSSVKTCAPDDHIADVMGQMTESRIRHLPVVEDSRLLGIISIGDVVKNRLEELESETNDLREYIVGRG